MASFDDEDLPIPVINDPQLSLDLTRKESTMISMLARLWKYFSCVEIYEDEHEIAGTTVQSYSK